MEKPWNYPSNYRFDRGYYIILLYDVFYNLNIIWLYEYFIIYIDDVYLRWLLIYIYMYIMDGLSALNDFVYILHIFLFYFF